MTITTAVVMTEYLLLGMIRDPMTRQRLSLAFLSLPASAPNALSKVSRTVCRGGVASTVANTFSQPAAGNAGHLGWASTLWWQAVRCLGRRNG